VELAWEVAEASETCCQDEEEKKSGPHPLILKLKEFNKIAIQNIRADTSTTRPLDSCLYLVLERRCKLQEER
jgi:hypothetical protein